MTAVEEHVETAPALGRVAGPRWVWAAAWVIAIAYAAGYGWMIHRHTAVPYFDQQNYVTKTYELVDSWHMKGSWLNRIEPGRYLAAGPATRPPLMMFMPAIVWGRHATAHEMAYAWLIERMAILLAGMWVLTRVVRDRRWVPAALCVILGSGFFWEIDPNLYVMDLPFLSIALLGAALVGYAMQRHSIRGYVLAALGTVAAFLVKPQGLIYMFLLMGMLSLERVAHTVIYFRRGGGEGAERRREAAALGGWAAVMIGLLLEIVHLLRGPYGDAIRAQYAWGQQGYWNVQLTWPYARRLLVGILPGWVAAALVVLLAGVVWAQVRSRPRDAARWFERTGWLLATFLVTLAFWLAFTMFLTYTVDPRIVWSIMPITVCVAMILLWRWRGMGIAATGIAVAMFGMGMGVALWGVPWAAVESAWAGAPIEQQHPVAEVGERALVARVESLVRAGPLAATPKRAVTVMVLTSAEYLDYAGMTLVSRWQNGDRWSTTYYEQFPWGDDGFDIAIEFDFQRAPWFITREGGPPSDLSTRALVNMRAMESLVVNPKSPIASLFERCAAVPIHVPLDDLAPGHRRDDEAVIWRLKRPLSPEECFASLSFVLPQYEGFVGQARMRQERQDYIKIVAQGNGLTLVPAATIAELRDALVRDVVFDNGLVLKAVRLAPAKGPQGEATGGRTLEMYWQATRDMALDNNRFIHLNNAAGAIVGQADGPQDAIRGHVRAGVCWLDAVTLTGSQLRGVATIGLGIQTPDGHVLTLSPAPGATLDWSNHRLIIPVK